MKKLTAGVFATILGLTAVDAFAGTKVASTGYVQGAIDSLATVAKTGSYTDLTNKPTIPSIEGLAVKSELDSTATATEGQVVTGVTMTDGAITVTSGSVSYNNLTDKPDLGVYVLVDDVEDTYVAPTQAQ
jgi:hypothetical protein